MVLIVSILLMMLFFTVSSSELIEKLKEIVVGYNLLKASSEEVKEVKQLACLDATHILKHHVDKVTLLDNACVLVIELLELRVKVKLQVLIYFVDSSKHSNCLWVLKDHLFFKWASWRLRSEGVLFVASKGRSTKVMLSCANRVLGRFIICKEEEMLRNIGGRRLMSRSATYSSRETLLSSIFRAVKIDIPIREMLTTVRADELILFQFACITINKSGPLIHLMTCLLIEFVLVVIVLLLKLLRQLPDHIVLEL